MFDATEEYVPSGTFSTERNSLKKIPSRWNSKIFVAIPVKVCLFVKEGAN
jgi:hypothetical protein